MTKRLCFRGKERVSGGPPPPPHPQSLFFLLSLRHRQLSGDKGTISQQLLTQKANICALISARKKKTKEEILPQLAVMHKPKLVCVNRPAIPVTNFITKIRFFFFF